MTDPDHTRIVTLAPPVQCDLWEHPEPVDTRFSDIFEELETYEDGSHLTRSLYKCRECGQRYFWEWYEWVDWQNGNDKNYSTLVPVQTDQQIDALKETDAFGLMLYFPRIQWDGVGPPRWNGKG